ncbi:MULTISPECIES: Wzz/FepE/Etk N-terminal domain-containing protein [unclassified Rhodosalinus]|uniref:polysaccharide biosynthesis tyrosine autokinase n=1 Tax=unclassified Rhodosalinus TaxID=2630183 RepID=UPI00352570D6
MQELQFVRSGQRPITLPAAAPEPDEPGLSDRLGALWRGRRTMAATTLLALALGAAYLGYLAEPRYRATATLALDVQGARVVDLEQVVGGLPVGTAAINTELEAIRSPALIGRLVADLGLSGDPEFNADLRPAPGWWPTRMFDALRDRLGRVPPPPGEGETRRRVVEAAGAALTVAGQPRSYVFTLSATTRDAAKSVRMVNTLAELHLSRQVEQKLRATDEAADWLSRRVRELDAELRAQEAELTRLGADRDVSGGPAALEAVSFQLAEHRRTRAEAAAAAAQATARAASLRAVTQGAEAPETGALAQMRQEGASEDAVRARAARLAEAAEAEAAQARATAARFAEAEARLTERSEGQAADRVRAEQMARDLDATRVLYESFLARLKETTVQRGLQRPDSRIVALAEGAEQVAPRMAVVLALAGLAGLVAGGALVLARDAAREGFRTAEELGRAAGAPVLGEVPCLPVRRRARLLSYLEAKTASPGAEAVRSLRTSLLFSDPVRPPRVVALLSSVPGEGKSTIAVALAHDLARLGRRVLLVEGDLRRRVLGQYLGGAGGAGLGAVMTGFASLEEAARPNPALGADVLPAGPRTGDAADLLAAPGFARLIEAARTRYDHVIIDTPPVLAVPDARLVAPLADAVVYVVRWNRTTREQLDEGLRQLDLVRAAPRGMVLSRVDPAGMRRLGHAGRSGAYAAYGRAYYQP